MMKKKRNFIIFLISFLCTSFLIVLLLGVAEVDYQSRRIGFGDDKTLIYQITGKNLRIACNDGKICYNYFVLLSTEIITEDFP